MLDIKELGYERYYMKKRKCVKTGWYLLSAIFSIFGVMHLLGLPIWKKYEGWQEPNTMTGILLLLTAFGVYKVINHLCQAPKTLKCTSCKEVFEELLTEGNKCPNCKGKLIDVDEYYQKPNKYEERNL